MLAWLQPVSMVFDGGSGPGLLVVDFLVFMFNEKGFEVGPGLVCISSLGPALNIDDDGAHVDELLNSFRGSLGFFHHCCILFVDLFNNGDNDPIIVDVYMGVGEFMFLGDEG